MGRAKTLFSLDEQRLIVKEAYSVPNNIKPTARKYRLQPVQIRKYKEKLEKCTDVDTSRYLIVYPKRQRSDSQESLFDHLRNLIEQLRERQQAVSIGFLMREARRFGIVFFLPDYYNFF